MMQTEVHDLMEQQFAEKYNRSKFMDNTKWFLCRNYLEEKNNLSFELVHVDQEVQTEEKQGVEYAVQTEPPD